MAHYRAPGWSTRHLLNPVVAAATRLGVSVYGSRVLRVRGRRSGEWRSTPVNLLSHEGARYLVAPRGDTQWVQNLRAAGAGELVVGRHIESIAAIELENADKPPILRAYLRRWRFEVGAFFEGVDATSSDDALLAAAPRHPVFRVDQARATQP